MPTHWKHDHQDRYAGLQWVTHPSLRAVIEAVVGTGERLLDLGAGTGTTLEWFRDSFPERRAVEFDEAMAAQIPDDVKVNIGRLEDHPWTGWADCVLMRNVLHYTLDPTVALQNAKRALRPGGRVVVVEGVPPTHTIVEWYARMFAEIDDRHIFTEGDLLHIAREAGLVVRRLVPAYLEGIDLDAWIADRVPEAAQDAVRRLHEEHREALVGPYEWDDDGMTWRFAVLEAS